MARQHVPVPSSTSRSVGAAASSWVQLGQRLFELAYTILTTKKDFAKRLQELVEASHAEDPPALYLRHSCKDLREECLRRGIEFPMDDPVFRDYESRLIDQLQISRGLQLHHVLIQPLHRCASVRLLQDPAAPAAGVCLPEALAPSGECGYRFGYGPPIGGQCFHETIIL